MYEKNVMMDNNPVAVQPIQAVPMAYMKPVNQSYMPMQLPHNPNISTLPNFNNASHENLLLPPPLVKECYGNPGIGKIMEDDSMLHPQRESCGNGCSCHFL